MDLYPKPTTPFVAKFIGSPTMNFLEGAAARDLGGVEVWIRPEHLEISAASGCWFGRLCYVEHLGGETLAYVVIPEVGQMIVKTDGEAEFRNGQLVDLSPGVGHLDVF